VEDLADRLSQRTFDADYDPDQQSLFNGDQFQTGWSRDKTDARLQEIKGRMGTHRSHVFEQGHVFHDRRPS
jgi:hypothetical protein